MKVVFVFTFLFNRCLADVCRGFGYEKDYLPESIDPKEYVNWTPIKEYTNGVELCCMDPCCTGYVFTWNNGSWVSRNIWNCSNFEECGAKPHFGFGTFIIAREKDALSPTCRSKIITKFVYANKCIDCTSETSTSTNEGMELTLTNDAPTSAATEATIIPEPTTTAEITINTELITTMKKRKQLLEGGAAVIILKNKTKFDKMNAVADALKPALFTSEGCIIYVIAICLLLFF